MNKELFKELEKLMCLKSNYEMFLETLKNKPYINKISLSKGMIEIYLDNADIEMLITYYENKIKQINEKIDKFKLSKIMLKIKYKGYEISQASNNHVMICKDNEALFRAQCNKVLNEDELKQELEVYLKITKALEEEGIFYVKD